jgi:hypothetical protein
MYVVCTTNEGHKTDVPEVTIINTDPDVISAYIISKITWAWAKICESSK